MTQDIPTYQQGSLPYSVKIFQCDRRSTPDEFMLDTAVDDLEHQNRTKMRLP